MYVVSLSFTSKSIINTALRLIIVRPHKTMKHTIQIRNTKGQSRYCSHKEKIISRVCKVHSSRKYYAKPKVRNITKRQREIGNIEEKIAILQLKKAKFEEEERVARAEQNLESVPESESEHSSMRTIIDLHQDHDDSLLTRAIVC